MDQKENKKIAIFQKGSIAVFALIIMFILSMATIGIIATASIERKSSISTGNSITAFQVAESGMEKTLQGIKTNFSGRIAEICSSCSCANENIGGVTHGVLTYPQTVADNTNKVKFKGVACNGNISNVDIIKSIGTNKKETRAVEEKIFLAATKLLLHLNGKNSDGKFEDSSYYYEKNKPITTNDTVAVETNAANLKFGGGSAEFDGATGYLSVPDSDNWDFGDGDFTIDFWVQFKALPPAGSEAVIFSHRQNDQHMVVASLSNSSGSKWSFKVKDGATESTILAPTAIAAGSNWYHIAYAYAKKENSFKIFQNGTSLATTGALSGDMPTNINKDVVIGQLGDNSYYFNGYLDELRISKGVARWWTSNFSSNLPAKEYLAD